MAFYWNNNKRSILLRLLEDVPSLWNKNHFAYHRHDINICHLRRIGEIVGCSGDKVQRQIKRLIERYKAHKERTNNVNGIKKNGTKSGRQFVLASQMQFLDEEFANLQYENLESAPKCMPITSTPKIIPQTTQPTVAQTSTQSIDNPVFAPTSLAPNLISTLMPNCSRLDNVQFITSPLPSMNIADLLLETMNHLITILQAGTNPNLTIQDHHFINLMTWAAVNLSNENQKLLMHTTIQIYLNQSRQ